MGVFVLFEMLVILAILWIISNILHFIFFKGTGGSFFYLSQTWSNVPNKGSSLPKIDEEEAPKVPKTRRTRSY